MHLERSKNVVVLLFLCSLASAASLAQPAPLATRGIKPHLTRSSISSGPGASTSATALRGGGRPADGNKSDDPAVLKDYRGEASSLFGNLRIPAALFAGASAGAAFAMPLVASTDGLKVGVVKRVYAILMIGSLSSPIVTVVTATLAMGSLAVVDQEVTSGVSDLLRTGYDLEWTTARLNFLSGLIMFSLGSGLRAWVSIACPVFARAALGIIVSATLLCVAFVSDTLRRGGDEYMTRLPLRFVVLMCRRAGKDPLFALAMVAYAITWAYTLWSVPHAWKWLATGN